MERHRRRPEDKRQFGGCVQIAEQRTEIARKRLAQRRAEEWGGDRKKRKKGNGRQPSGNAILFDLFFQHGLLSILFTMAQGAGLMITAAFGGLAKLVTGTGATVAVIPRETAPLPTPSPVIASDATRTGPTRRRAPRLDGDGRSGGGGGPSPEPAPRDPLDKIATKIMHDLNPPEDKWEGDALVRKSHPAIAAFLYDVRHMNPEMVALRNELKRLVKGDMPKAVAMAQCMPVLEGIMARDAAARADFQQPGTENDGDGPGARRPLNPGEEPPPSLPTPKWF